jgi:hypothetical protein
VRARPHQLHARVGPAAGAAATGAPGGASHPAPLGRHALGREPSADAACPACS